MRRRRAPAHRPRRLGLRPRPPRRGDAAARARVAPSASACARSVMPRQAPAERSHSADWPGRKACSVSFQASLPRDCENRCTLGVKPPDISTASQSMRRDAAPARAGRRPARSARTRRPPSVPSTVESGQHRRCRRGAPPRAASPDGLRRARSATAATTDAGGVQVERRLIGGVARGHDHDAGRRPVHRSGSDRSARRRPA